MIRTFLLVLNGLCVLLVSWQCAEKTHSNVLSEVTDDFYEADVISSSVHSSLIGEIHSNKISSFEQLMMIMDSLVFLDLPEEVKVSLQKGFFWAYPVPSDGSSFTVSEEHSLLTKKVLDKRLISERIYQQTLESLRSFPCGASFDILPTEEYCYIVTLRQHLQQGQSNPIITNGPQ